MVFTKHNHSRYPDALFREAEGLELLRQVINSQAENTVRIPEVIQVSDNQLQLTHISGRQATLKQWQQLGEGLALLHKQPQAHYGLETDNHIGLNPQPNGISHDWGDFFIHQRLKYQLSLVTDSGVQKCWQQLLHQHFSRLREFLNDNCLHPSLLHGDLWNGNIMFSEHSVWLVDPAVYYGDREADLAMTEMFGGFGKEFYRAYDRIYPRTEAYRIKREIYNLYHYLNHYNLFGSGYFSGCISGWQTIEKL